MDGVIEDFFKGRDTGLEIDWTQMPTYNTIMAIAAGAGLIFMYMLGRALLKDKDFRAEGWALTAGVLGFILTTTGLHMTLVWPFAMHFPFDNIVFGEPSLGLGVLLLATCLFLWKRGDRIVEAEDRAAEAAAVAKTLGIFIVGLGVAKLVGWLWLVTGIIFLLFGAMNFYMHIGLIVNTM